MVTARTQRSAKVTEEERLAALPELKAQIRRTDPNLSAAEVERRALIAAGLDPGVDPADAERLMREPSRARKAAANVASRASGGVKLAATSSGARRLIFGVMVTAVIVGWVRDIQKGRRGVTDAMPRRLVSAFVAMFLLMVLAGPAPSVAKGLAILIGFSVVAFNVETVDWVSARFGRAEQPGAGGGSLRQ